MGRSGPKPQPLLPRFLKYVDMSGDCWIWTGAQHRGYGRLWNGKRMEGAHRISYRIFRGPIPKGLFVCHACDNPPCVKPDHLWLGTNADNAADAARKGRMKPPCLAGEDQGSSILTEAEVVQILESSESHTDTANRFGVSISTISLIRMKKAWRHIDTPAAYYEQRNRSESL